MATVTEFQRWRIKETNSYIRKHNHKKNVSLTSLITGGDKKGWGKIYLYFGCRNSKVDDIYKEELQQMKAEGVLTEVYTALSREPDTPKVRDTSSRY